MKDYQFPTTTHGHLHQAVSWNCSFEKSSEPLNESRMLKTVSTQDRLCKLGKQFNFLTFFYSRYSLFKFKIIFWQKEFYTFLSDWTKVKNEKDVLRIWEKKPFEIKFLCIIQFTVNKTSNEIFVKSPAVKNVGFWLRRIIKRTANFTFLSLKSFQFDL